MARDKGSDRALVRDIVDSRFSVGTYFIVALFLIVFGSSPSMPRSIQAGANLLLLFIVLAFAVDCVLLCRRVRKMVAERLPKEDHRWRGLYWYAIMRTLSFRRLRIPKPRVKPGDTI
jgi:Protein of unknown function (DUF3043)